MSRVFERKKYTNIYLENEHNYKLLIRLRIKLITERIVTEKHVRLRTLGLTLAIFR